jgi:hypothetical protein
MASIALLKAQGYVGADVSLAISLGEYGLAWKELPDGEFIFIHRHPTMRGRFDRTSMRPVDPEKEWSWADWGEMLSHLGMDSLGEFKGQPFPQQVYDMVNYYGVENVFGSSYWEGFTVEGAEEED